MNKDNNEQEWQQLQFRIKKFVDGFLKEDSPAIEHKTRIAGFLQSPPEYNEQDLEETA